MEKIFFKPWIGEQYQASPLSGKRVLVLGESCYQWDKDIPLGPDFTIRCVTEQKAGRYPAKFWTNIVIAFLNKRPTTQEKEAFWSSVAFYNYVQRPVGWGPRKSPSKEMWQEGADPFAEILEQLSPQLVIVLGFQLWRQLPDLDGQKGPRISSTRQPETWQYSLENGSCLAYGVMHPSAAFSGKYWHPYIMEAFEFRLTAQR